MTDGHGVSLDRGREQHTRRILTEVEAGNGVSQRSLARNVGIALGLTNLLLKRLIRKGWVRIIHVKPNRVKYLITPAGIAEKARMSSRYFAYTTRFYAEARERVRERFAVLSAEWSIPPHPVSASDAVAAVQKRIVFYGAGEVAEIGYVCLQETDLSIVAAVDDHRTGRFFGKPVYPLSWLEASASWDEFSVLVVMAFGEADVARAGARLAAIDFPPSRVFWI